jgi:hypothetical protein
MNGHSEKMEHLKQSNRPLPLNNRRQSRTHEYNPSRVQSMSRFDNPLKWLDRHIEDQKVNTDIIKTITLDFAGLQEIAEREGWDD